MSVFSISAPDEFMDDVDARAEAAGYAGRSDFVRAALREFLQQLGSEEARDGEQSATITVAYPEGRDRRLADLKHEFTDIVTSMIHSHNGEGCVEVLIVEGPAGKVHDLVNRLRSLRDVDRLNVFYVE